MQANDLSATRPIRLPAWILFSRPASTISLDWTIKKNDLLQWMIRELRIPRDIVRMVDAYLICPHKARCHLLSTQMCCSCADRTTSSTVHVDGKGVKIVKHGAKKSDIAYCPGCRGK